MEEFGPVSSFASILLTALVTTVGTWIVTRYSLSQDRATRQEELDRNATYLAVRVSNVIDPFVMACIDVVNDSGRLNQEGVVEPEHPTPRPDLPQDVEWKSIDPHLMDRILSLPNEISASEKSIAFVGDELSGPPDYDEWFEERQYEWAKLGLVALDLARDLRDRYKLPQRDYSRYDPRVTLEHAFRKEDELRKKAAESARQLGAKG